jgi:hypothetical protein
MAVFTLFSASGSPGVTATVLGLASHWEHPVLVVDADPTGGGGMLSGFFKAALPQQTGSLVDMRLAQQRGTLARDLLQAAVEMPGTQARIVTGMKSLAQLDGLRAMWGPLSEILPSLGVDVLIDCGRLGLAGWPEPLITDSTLPILVARGTLRHAAAARDWVEVLNRRCEVPPRLLAVGRGDPYPAGELGKALGLAVLPSVPLDSSRASVYSDGADPVTRFKKPMTKKAFARSAYCLSLKALAIELRRIATQGTQTPGNFPEEREGQQ